MKKLVLLLFAMLFGLQMVDAESYQRWIYWINQSDHVASAMEIADITASLGRKEISAQKTYKLSTGISYQIPRPDLYLQYIEFCVKEGEPFIITTQDVVRAIQKGEMVKWGNDINCKVKNFYYSSLHNMVRYIDNYSGANDGVPVILINGKPKIKADCGNPLWVIDDKPVPVPVLEPVSIPVVIVKETTPAPAPAFVLSSYNKINNSYSTNYYQQPNVVKKRGEIKIGRIIIPVAAMAVAAIAILAKKGNTNNFTINNNPSREPTPGGPGGAPVTPPDTPPVVTPPVDPGGGPGGANTTR